MTENVCTVYKLIWFMKTKLLAMRDSCLNVRLNYAILMTSPSQAQIKTFPFQETSMICGEIQIWQLGSLELATVYITLI